MRRPDSASQSWEPGSPELYEMLAIREESPVLDVSKITVTGLSNESPTTSNHLRVASSKYVPEKGNSSQKSAVFGKGTSTTSDTPASSPAAVYTPARACPPSPLLADTATRARCSQQARTPQPCTEALTATVKEVLCQAASCFAAESPPGAAPAHIAP
eukprot:CAMPEP_0115571554 /NCGR_PEP_ID=MMETSP0272-20121206/2_1 /TAXON_ID=71861 /ORGANISM="Scrippsiella trochoidea, Strain CCMP3099" /LENGTH=157 /DNA_ID=CAMNT_0003006109 /DNA_START=1025 /DNA_END=1499 /DNA_ORIENTATION=-